MHQGCDSDLSADFLHFGASNFPSKNAFKKCLKIVFFSLWRGDPVLSQADAAWVRNVIADSENFLPDLLREVP